MCQVNSGHTCAESMFVRLLSDVEIKRLRCKNMAGFDLPYREMTCAVRISIRMRQDGCQGIIRGRARCQGRPSYPKGHSIYFL